MMTLDEVQNKVTLVDTVTGETFPPYTSNGDQFHLRDYQTDCEDLAYSLVRRAYVREGRKIPGQSDPAHRAFAERVEERTWQIGWTYRNEGDRIVHMYYRKDSR